VPKNAEIPVAGASTALDPTEFASTVSAITAAFGDPTRREIYLFVHATGAGVTATQVASRFDLHPNVARHHLDKLAAGGYLEIATARRAGAGRPSKEYRLVDEALPFEIGVRIDDVIISLLGRALAELGAERADALAEDVGLEYGRAMAEAMGDTSAGHRSVRAALHAVADALSAKGFAAHAESSDGDHRIVSEHCPFGDAVIDYPVMCAIDRGMVAGMIGTLYGETPVGLTSSKPQGDDHCVTAIDA
jgi:predicted ArsR family transcriptional regulator